MKLFTLKGELSMNNKRFDMKSKKRSKTQDNVMIKYGVNGSKNTNKNSTNTVKMGIGTKLFLGFLVPIALIVLLGVISYQKSANGLMKSYVNSSEQSLKAVADYLSYGLNSASSITVDFVTDDALDKYLNGRLTESYEASQALKNIKKQFYVKQVANEFIQGIYIIPSANTNVINQSGITDGFYEELKAQEDEFETKIKYGSWFGSHDLIDTKMSMNSTSYAMTFMRVCNSKNACIVVDIEPKTIEESLSTLVGSKDDICGFVSNEGKEVIVAGDNSYVAEATQDTAEESETTPVFTTLSKYQDALNSTSTQGHSYVSYNGKTYMFFYIKMQDQDAMLCSLIPKTEILQQASSIKIVSITIVILGCIIATAIAILLSKLIGNSISSLRKQLEVVASGDFTTDIKVTSKDEMNILANNISDTLRSIRGLIAQVAGITKQVGDSANLVANSTSELETVSAKVTQAVGQINQAIETEAEESQHCVNDMEELSSRINTVDTKVVQIKTFADSTKRMVEEDIDSMQQLNQQSERAAKMMDHLAVSIHELEEKSKSVNAFIEIINGISEQTNLLSLNASIEAARAGEAGRGFAVVAEEIRKLSEESAAAASQIQKVAKDITEQTQSTVDDANTAGTIVMDQNRKVTQIIKAFQELNQGVEELYQNIETIASDIDDMSATRATTLDSISNISASSEETYSVSLSVDDIMKEQETSVQQLKAVSVDLIARANDLENAIKQFKIEK